MEISTHDDIWSNYLKYRKELSNTVLLFLSNTNADKISELETNDKYAAAMARIHYMRVAEPLPRAGDISGQVNSNILNANQLIAEKVNLYKKIINLVNLEAHESFNIVIELNPYVLLKSDKFELTQCNVFFRHSRGRYITKTGSLR